LYVAPFFTVAKDVLSMTGGRVETKPKGNDNSPSPLLTPAQIGEAKVKVISSPLISAEAMPIVALEPALLAT
jgi:hypothetical protein